jgi:hypothetical protein
MKKVPDMISTKDLAYIKDIFNWNIIASKKIEVYLENTDDEEISKELNKLNKLHLKNCKELIKILKESDFNEG